MKNRALELARLRGVLSGIGTDKSINESELLFLDAWLRDRQETLNDNGDVIDLLEQISDVLEDGVITQEEMEDTLNLIDCILEYQDNPPITDDQQEVFGFIQGVVSDGCVRDIELKHILKTLKPLSDVPMFALLSQRIDQQRNDHDKLIATLKSFSGFYFNETGTTQDWSCFLGDAIPGDFNFDGAKVCFTGGITGVPRSSLKRQVSNMGAVFSKSFSSGVDILVVGDECSRGWIENNYGTKLDAACKLKLKGGKVLIVSSNEWLVRASNVVDPRLDAREKAWAKFGDALCFDSLVKAVNRVCEGVPLTVSEYQNEELDRWVVAIHRQWKSGKPLKKMELFFEHSLYHYNVETGEQTDRARPWVVGGGESPVVSFQHKNNAFERFRELAASLVALHS